MVGIEDKIKHMTREQKYAEFKSYLCSGGLLNIDVDRIKADQAAMGAPDSALDDALLKCARLAGAALGREPMTAQELAEALKDRPPDMRAEIRRNGRQSGRSLLECGVHEFSLTNAKLQTIRRSGGRGK